MHTSQAHVKTGCFVFVLGCFALAGQAHAVPALPSSGAASLILPVVDEETAIEQMERPDEVAPGSQEEATPKGAAPPPAASDSSEGPEEQELKRMFPSTEYPPDKE